VDLVWEVGETNVAHQLFTNDRGETVIWNEGRVGCIGHAIRGDVPIAGGGVGVGHLVKQMRIRTEGERSSSRANLTVTKKKPKKQWLIAVYLPRSDFEFNSCALHATHFISGRCPRLLMFSYTQLSSGVLFTTGLIFILLLVHVVQLQLDLNLENWQSNETRGPEKLFSLLSGLA
jgi:hypothetical protein